MGFSTSYGFNSLGAPTQINVTTANAQYFPGVVMTDLVNAAVFYYDNGASGGHLFWPSDRPERRGNRPRDHGGDRRRLGHRR